MAAQQQQAHPRPASDFEDFLPTMAEKLGGEALMEELCAGFRLLMDPRLGLITFESLKRNAALMGLGGLGDDELLGMLQEGDINGDGALDETEFCVLMFRLSPELMEESWRVAEEAVGREIRQQHQQQQQQQYHHEQYNRQQAQRGYRYSS